MKQFKRSEFRKRLRKSITDFIKHLKFSDYE
jgi:hypothetical protein